MTSECLSFAAIPHTSQLFRDYLYHFDRVQRFYPHDPGSRDWIPAAPAGMRYDSDRRRHVADILERQNRSWGASDKTLASIQRLRSGAVAAVTGQQVSLFGGPLFSILKAITAVRLAEQSQALGVDCVPVFWLATEDHDLAEVNHIRFLSPEGAIETLATDSQGEAGAPMSDVRLGPEIEPILDRALQILGFGDVSGFLRDAYRPGETLGSSFARLFAKIFAGWGVILLDAADPELHAITQPVYSAAITNAEEIDTALLRRGQELRDAGYHEQVKVTPASTLLFKKKNGARVVIHRANGGFEIAGNRVSRDDLLARIESEPSRFSANVLLRPVVQDFLLPTIAYTGGPAEVAYFAQAAVVYEKVLGRVTPVLPRFSATIVDARAQRLMAKYRLALPDLFHGPDVFREILAVHSLPADLQASFEAADSAITNSLDQVRRSLEKLDATLVESAARAGSKMLYQLRRLRGRAANAELRRQREIGEHAAWLSSALFPEKNLQERELAGVVFLARHGLDLLQTLHDAADAACPDHRIVYL